VTDYTRPVVKNSTAAGLGQQSSADTNLTGAIWSKIEAHGDGLVRATSLTTNAAALTLSGDSATVGLMECRVDGFVFTRDASAAFTIPATAGTYFIGVTQTTANDARADLGGRLTLNYYASGSQPAGFFPLWSFTRTTAPMSGATPTTDLRQFAGEDVYVNGLTLPTAAFLGQAATLSDGSRWRVIPNGTSAVQWSRSPAAASGASGFLTGSGWTVTAQEWARVDRVVSWVVSITRTGGPIGPSASGNIGNTVIGTVSAAFRPVVTAPFAVTAAGPLVAGYTASSGSMALAAIPPNYTLINGTILNIGGTHITA
jgi:hypothetical protein